MRNAIAKELGLDPSVTHLNHGAFGCVPETVRSAQWSWQQRSESNPHRFNRVELPHLVERARASAAEFLGVEPEAGALVRNVSEGISAVLASLELKPGDEVLVNNHGYGAVRIAVRHWVRRRGAQLVEARFAVDAGEAEVVAAYASAASSRTRLAIVDQITSPTAAVLPVAAVAAAVDAPVLVDAAHVPGTLPTDIASLGATYWVGNLHKWAYTPRGSAVLWTADSARSTTFPSVLSWQLEDGYAGGFDHPGTWDYSGWLAIPDGLAYWHELGGRQAVEDASALVTEGQSMLADALGTSLDGLPSSPAPTMRLVRLPGGAFPDDGDADGLYERLSTEHRIEAAVVDFEGSGYVRVAAAPYNTIEDYRRLADALLTHLASRCSAVTHLQSRCSAITHLQSR